MFGEEGDDEVQLVHELDEISSQVAFAGGDGTDRLVIDDSLASTGKAYRLNGNTVQRGVNELLVGFDLTLENLDFKSTPFDDVLSVGTLPSGFVAMRFDLGDANDAAFGPNQEMDWLIRNGGSLRLGANMEIVGAESATGGSADDTFRLVATALQTDSTPVSIHGGLGDGADLLVSPATVRAEVSLEQRTVNGVLTFLGFERIRGNHHNDRIKGADQENVWRVTGDNSGTVRNVGQSNTIGFTSFESLLGGNLTDRFMLEENGSILGPVNGGPGNDWLDYRNRAKAVYVDLNNRQANDVGSAVSIENVRGGSGDDFIVGDHKRNVLRGGPGKDILVGNEGNDLMFGDEGRDLMIGGVGRDKLYGFSGEDILIGGSTAHDASRTDLGTVMEIWSNSNLRFETRVEQIRDGKGGVALSKETVADDGQVDQLFGQADLDWLWDGVDDELTQDDRTGRTSFSSGSSSDQPEKEKLEALVSGEFVAVDTSSDEILLAHARFPADEEVNEFNWTNANNRFDVNGDDAVTPLDALLIINYLNRSSGKLPELNANPSEFVDVSQDGFATPLDALNVINRLNAASRSVFVAEGLRQGFGNRVE